MTSEAREALIDPLIDNNPVTLQILAEGFAEGIVSVSNVLYFVGIVCVGAALARFSFDLRRVGV